MQGTQLSQRSKSFLALAATLGLALSLAGCVAPQKSPEDEVSQFQQELIKDGTTDAEFQQSADASVECMNKEGLTASVRLVPGSYPMNFNFTIKEDPTGPIAKLREGSSAKVSEADKLSLRVQMTCMSENFIYVQYEYQLAHTLAGQEREEGMADLIECMETTGGVSGVLAGDERLEIYRKIEAVYPDPSKRDLASSCMSTHLNLFPPEWPILRPDGGDD